jgi:hypothetical protein
MLLVQKDMWMIVPLSVGVITLNIVATLYDMERHGAEMGHRHYMRRAFR